MSSAYEHGAEHRATVLITTCNRRESVRMALLSAIDQTADAEVVVVDDGSSDGTAEMIRREFAEVRLIQHATSTGVIAARNAGFRQCRGEFVFTLDDDAVYRDSATVEQVIRLFSDGFIGAVSLCLANHYSDGSPTETWGRECSSEDYSCVPQFRGGANAIRRRVIETLGGYTGVCRQGEERSFSLRMLSDGYVVRQASSAWVDHYPKVHATQRAEVHYWNLRNSLDFVATHAPFPDSLYRLGRTTVGHLLVASKSGHFGTSVRALGASVRDLPRQLRNREPVRRGVFRVFQQLMKAGEMPVSHLRCLLARYGVRLADE